MSRRYGDFRTLAEEASNFPACYVTLSLNVCRHYQLRKAHPSEDVRAPPQKDKTATSFMSSTLGNLRGNNSSSDPSAPGLTRTSTVSSLESTTPLQREKNRLTLRAYIHTLLASSTLASSPVLESFLVSEPTTLTPEEEEDARRRVEVDRIREEGRQKFAQEIGNRVDKLRQNIMGVKGDIMGQGKYYYISHGYTQLRSFVVWQTVSPGYFRP